MMVGVVLIVIPLMASNGIAFHNAPIVSTTLAIG